MRPVGNLAGGAVFFYKYLVVWTVCFMHCVSSHTQPLANQHQQDNGQPWSSDFASHIHLTSSLRTCVLGPLSSNLRSLSEVQESAQLLTGTDLPNTVLASLFGKLTTSSALVINATPYDGCLESTLLTWHQFNEMKVDFLSISRNVTTLEYVEKKIAFSLLQDFWFLFLSNKKLWFCSAHMCCKPNPFK